jgi:hypothetical protein
LDYEYLRIVILDGDHPNENKGMCGARSKADERIIDDPPYASVIVFNA